jgi:AhpD family alkylhydroperoxidase
MPMSHHARSEYRDFQAQAPDAYNAVSALGQIAAKAGMDKQLLELVKLRASQINGCAFCVQYHILQAESLGLSADKLNLLVVWREAPQFSSRERAALAWTEALTFLPDGVSDEVYAQASAEFSEKELLYLTSAVVSINAWNRFGAAFRWTPPARKAQGAAAS